MKSIKIITVVIFSFTFISCGSEEYSTEYENWFGYYSRYKGQTNHAYYNGYTDAEAMAKKVVDGINTAKKLYRTSITALIPPIFLDNNTTYMYDNLSVCPASTGWREYNSKPVRSIPNPDNYTFECFINYFNYCLNDNLDSSPRNVIIDYQNTASKQKILANYKGIDGTKKINYELEAKDINVKINESTGSDNITIFGLVIKDATYNTDNITSEDPSVPKTVILRLDMPKEETQYRFYFYSDNGTLNFYHYKYGYVTIDISDFINSTRPIDNRAKITMIYQENKQCRFSISEFGTRDFNCDYGYDQQEPPISS